MIQPTKRVTLRDLARELGLSDRAVSQALNPRESNVQLNPKTVERVQELAARWNYRRDSRARSMRYGRYNNVGYFEAKKKATAWSLLGAEAGVCDAAIDHDYHIVLIRQPSEMADAPSSIPAIFRESNLDALILSHAGNLPEELEQIIDSSGFPVVYLNEKKPHNAVYVDDLSGAEEITRHLISLGNHKIGYYSDGPDTSHYSAADRKLGYKTAMRQAGLTPNILSLKPNSPSEFLAWLEANKGMEAIVCYNDLTALRVFRHLYNTPLKVPKDLAVTGFGDGFALDCSPVLLTTMRIPFYEMGKAALEMALELVQEKQTTVPALGFSQELVVRDSTRNRLVE